MNVTKKRLVREISEDTNLTRADARKALDSFLRIVVDNLSNGNVISLPNWGSFRTRLRSKRQVPSGSGGFLVIPAKRVVVFRAGKAFANRVAKGEGQSE
jgi:DNA-binding protein HU-beta